MSSTATITTATATTTMSLGLRRITTLGRKNPWPDPQLSLGDCWCSIGSNQCWEAVGPAKEKYDEVSVQIKSLLESRHEYLNEGICVRRWLMFGLYMIGRTKELARPTIIFSCENKTQRLRAQRLVRESGILNGYPGVALGEASRPLRLSSSPKLVCDRIPSLDVDISENVDIPKMSTACVFYSEEPAGTHGIPVAVCMLDPASSPNARKSTLGLLLVGDALFGLTTAHALLDDPDEEERYGGDMEFSLEEEDECRDTDDYCEDFVDITSRGRENTLKKSSKMRITHRQVAHPQNNGLKPTRDLQMNAQRFWSMPPARVLSNHWILHRLT